jgi:uncharacterized membrane protein
MMLATIGFFVGIVLGQRFKVTAVLPTIAIALVLAIGVGIVRADTLWWIAVVAAMTATGIQAGYLVGIIVPHVLAVARANRSAAGALTGSAPTRHPTH